MAAGSPLRATRRLASRSAVDRTPSETSTRTRRGVADPRWLPSRSSAASCAGVHSRRWTVSAISSVISAAEWRRRAPSRQARTAGVSGTPSRTIAGGSRVVRSTTTNSRPLELPLLGHEQVDLPRRLGPAAHPVPTARLQAGHKRVGAAVHQRGGDLLLPCGRSAAEQDDAGQQASPRPAVLASAGDGRPRHAETDERRHGDHAVACRAPQRLGIVRPNVHVAWPGCVTLPAGDPRGRSGESRVAKAAFGALNALKAAFATSGPRRGRPGRGWGRVRRTCARGARRSGR